MGRWEVGGKHSGIVGGKKPKGYSFYAGGNVTMWCFLCEEEHPYHKPTRAEKRARQAKQDEPPQHKARFSGGRAA